MIQNVPLDAITTDRVLSDDDDLTELMKSIEAEGIVIPIVVGSGMELIDGLRRLEAARLLDLNEVPVLATSSYSEATAGIGAAREHGVAMRDISGDRVWELYRLLREITFIPRNVTATGSSENSARGLLIDALGIKSPSLFQAITQLHRMAEDPDPDVSKRAQEAVERIKKGERTYYGTANTLKRTAETKGSITKPASQRATIEGSLASIRGALKALEQLSTLDKSFTLEELNGYLTELGVIRSRTTKYIKLFTEEINKR